VVLDFVFVILNVFGIWDLFFGASRRRNRRISVQKNDSQRWVALGWSNILLSRRLELAGHIRRG
jgi:hypothetical protein